MHRYLSACLLSACLLLPVALIAEDHHDNKRYYDKEHHDYHRWDDREDKAYRVYLGDQHRDYSEFGRETQDRRREYFRWRHEHPDSVLFKVEVR